MCSYADDLAGAQGIQWDIHTSLAGPLELALLGSYVHENSGIQVVGDKRSPELKLGTSVCVQQLQGDGQKSGEAVRTSMVGCRGL